MKQTKKKSKAPIPKRSDAKRKKALERQKTKNIKNAELRVLILEDNPADAELMERQLKRDGIAFVSLRVDTRNGFLQALKSFKPDLILADYALPKFDALQALALCKKDAPLTPFIIVTGAVSEEVAVECMKQGADDYLLKDRLARLGEAVKRALAKRRLEAEKTAADETLQELNEIFRLFFKHSPIYVFIKDQNTRPVHLSDNYEKMLGKPLGEILGKSMDELFPSGLSRSMVEDDKRILREGKSHEFIEELNGRTYSTLKFPILIDDKAKYLAGYTIDITERKQAEEQVHASLLEKEVLLKEIHHRVKNNLQIISGLLTLQAAQINDERLQRIVRECQSRIWTMALIHQTLYQSGNLADIDMADYFRTLSGNLLSVHTQSAMPPTVRFDLLPLRLPIDKAIPLALIINELVTNALKHAFPDGRPGEIRIGLQECRGTARVPPNGGRAPAYEVTVADDGAGLPAGFDAKNQKSLGLQLVAMLAKQLGGTLAIEQGGGAVFRVSFPHNDKSKKQT